MRGLNTLIGILRQTGADHLIDWRWRRGDRRWLVLENRSDETGLAVATESCLAGDHFIKHEAECEDIAARVGFFAVKELRRHVLNRPENLPLLGHLLDGCFRGRRLDVLFGEPEIEQLHARLREHDVRRLQIAVDDSLPMCFVQSVGDLNSVLQHLLEWQRPVSNPLRQRLPLAMLHDQIIGTNVVERANVWVVDRGDRFRFAFEAKAQLRVLREISGQNLDGHCSIESRVTRPIDLPHSARPDRRDDLVRPEPHSRCEFHWNCRRILLLDQRAFMAPDVSHPVFVCDQRHMLS